MEESLSIFKALYKHLRMVYSEINICEPFYLNIIYIQQFHFIIQIAIKNLKKFKTIRDLIAFSDEEKYF